MNKQTKSHYGELLGPGEIRFVRRLATDIDTAWSYLVEPDRRARWFAGGEFELEPGGRAEFVFDHSRLCRHGDGPPDKYADMDHEIRMEARVLEVSAPRRLVLEWPYAEGALAIVTFELEEDGERTRLTVTESGLDRPQDLQSAAAGWHTHLDVLVAVAGDRPPPSFWRLHTVLEADYAERLAQA